MGKQVDWNECTCDCHTNESIMHCMPCCHTCPNCGKYIKFSYEEHVKECSKELDNEITRIIKVIIKEDKNG